ncbi:DEAH-box ATP-dependent RNA helicase prp43 [Tulasnella sp. UAMH 9824]|nr:DEAH-box ATP-dependent RNA helicase prp43 [Tulasnella sp. UAMH 9824]
MTQIKADAQVHASYEVNPFGSMPRHAVSAAHVEAVLKSNINPFTGLPLSEKYKTILEGRMNLPVYKQMQRFYNLYNNYQTTILIGETGSGKTTQLPQFVVYSDQPHLRGQMVACTQPRRVAAMAAARRAAEELDVPLGKQVGYTIRFEDVTEPGVTFLKYMTDGMLLREAMNDPTLSRYSTIILDEAHERTLATDILMGLVKQLTKTRPDLKLIVMSATFDALKFQTYFKNPISSQPAPLLKVPGRIFPVETFYTEENQDDYVVAAIQTALQIHQTSPPGDILVFLTGEEEIEMACRIIRQEAEDLCLSRPNAIGPLSCVPLYSNLPPQQQQKIFEPPPPRKADGPQGRKVVVATNVAETSLTIDGIVYVVDPGFVKVYNPRMRVESLLVSPISKASAQQRAGRAGRTRPGQCYRLYTEKAFNTQLEEQSHPEILRSNLANTVLQLMKLGIRDLVHFDYMDGPAPETVMRALELLTDLGALSGLALTDLGKTMAEFPLDPQMSKMLLSSPQFHCSSEVLTLVAMLSVPPVHVRPNNKRNEADAAKATFAISGGDHLGLINVYNMWLRNQQNPNWAWTNYLNLRALQQAQNVRLQIQRIAEKFGFKLVSPQDVTKIKWTNVQKALVSGYFSQVAFNMGPRAKYATVKDNEVVYLHPSSGLDAHCDWVIFNEFVLTTQPYIRTVTEVRPEW